MDRLLEYIARHPFLVGGTAVLALALLAYEVSRARFDKNWIAMAAEVQDNAGNDKFNADLMYLGEDGKPVFMPKADGPPKSLAYPYRPDHSMTLDPVPPAPYKTFKDTFEY